MSRSIATTLSPPVLFSCHGLVTLSTAGWDLAFLSSRKESHISKTSQTELKGSTSFKGMLTTWNPGVSRRYFFCHVFLNNSLGFEAVAGGAINVGLLSPLSVESKTPSPEKYSFNHLRCWNIEISSFWWSHTSLWRRKFLSTSQKTTMKSHGSNLHQYYLEENERELLLSRPILVSNTYVFHFIR